MRQKAARPGYGIRMIDDYGHRPVFRGAACWMLTTLALGVAVTGCSSTMPPSTPRALPAKIAVTACDLLTVPTIKLLTGTQLDAGTPAAKAPSGGSICDWERSAGRDPQALVQIQLRQGHGRADYEQRRRELDKSEPGKARMASVAGADEAYEIADQGVVAVVVGNTFFQVATIGGSFDTHEHLELAAAAVKKLTK